MSWRNHLPVLYYVVCWTKTCVPSHLKEIISIWSNILSATCTHVEMHKMVQYMHMFNTVIRCEKPNRTEVHKALKKACL